MENGFEPNLMRFYGDNTTILMQLVNYGHVDWIGHTVDLGADPNLHDDDGFTAVDYAITAGLTDAAGVLLDHGFDPNNQDPNGDTSLIRAAHQGRGDIVRLLISRGARTGRDR